MKYKTLFNIYIKKKIVIIGNLSLINYIQLSGYLYSIFFFYFGEIYTGRFKISHTIFILITAHF